MDWVLLGLLLGALVLLWDLRRRQPRTHVPRAGSKAERKRRDFPGAVPPNRYVVVRWPQGRLEYQGCIGAHARRVWEHTHPAQGEEIEFWEMGDCRGHK